MNASLSIGEVLNLLKDEFPEVTVSKIRFLETEGLVHPERTSSGYRKFSATDVDSLRFVLRQQRDHFLPLKVIRERLAEWQSARNAPAPETPADRPAAAGQPAQPAGEEPEWPLPGLSGVSMSRAELENASALDGAQLRELETFGLINAKRSQTGEPRYDEIALEIARLARHLLDLPGIEPRHLRMFRSAADRWTALADQMVLPLVKQRNPEARRQAADTVRELSRVGNRLLQALLREGMQSYT